MESPWNSSILLSLQTMAMQDLWGEEQKPRLHRPSLRPPLLLPVRFGFESSMYQAMPPLEAR
jgi:hypothetical protein